MLFDRREAGLFPSDRGSCSDLEFHEHGKHEMNEVVKRLIEFERRIQDEYESIISHIKHDNSIFKDTYATSFTTFTESVRNEIATFKSNVDSTVSVFTSSIEGKYSKELADAIANLTESFGNSFTDFQTKLATDINMFEATVNTNINNFTRGVNESNRIHRETVDTVLSERLNSQDTALNDAVMYLKTNLTASIRAEINDMYERGELDAIVNESVPYENFLIIDSITNKVYNIYVNNGQLSMIDTGKTTEDFEV